MWSKSLLFWWPKNALSECMAVGLWHSTRPWPGSIQLISDGYWVAWSCNVCVLMQFIPSSFLLRALFCSGLAAQQDQSTPAQGACPWCLMRGSEFVNSPTSTILTAPWDWKASQSLSKEALSVSGCCQYCAYKLSNSPSLVNCYQYCF
jgi:hypothetical protein